MILVIIVTYNGLEWIEGLLQPFVCDREGLDIAIVDNASTDGTPQIVLKGYPFVRIIQRHSNLGFGAANNILLEEAISKDYSGVFLLNQDASISATSIRALADFADTHSEVGILSPTHLDKQGNVEAGFAHYLPRMPQSSFTEVPFINAALWYLPRRTLIKVGTFSPLFYHYGEDLDYAHRVQAEGLKVGYLPSITAFHFREMGTLSLEKSLQLKQAYHLAEAINPLYSPLKRFFRGFVMPFGEAIKAPLSLANCYLKMLGCLWSLRPIMRLWMNRPAVNVTGLKRTMSQQEQAPVLLFVYNRPQHTRRIFEQLLRQPEIESTHIYIWSDGPKGNQDSDAVQEVRAICRSLLPQATLHEQISNVGLANNVVEGVSTILKTHTRVIVLEDDLILSPYFLRWMNDTLNCYENNPEIAHIHAGTFYTSSTLKNNHLLHFAGSWGWATWQDRWKELWEPNGQKLLDELMAKPDVRRQFNYYGYMDFTRMLRQQVEGLNNSWAVRWHASLVLHHRLSVSCNPPLVANRGFDNSGTHSGGGGRYNTPVAPFPIYAEPITSPTESKTARHILTAYYRRTNNKLAKAWYKLREILTR